VFRSDCIDLITLIKCYFMCGWFKIELLHFNWLKPFFLRAGGRLFFYDDLKHTFT